jgi:hypothetical protein
MRRGECRCSHGSVCLTHPGWMACRSKFSGALRVQAMRSRNPRNVDLICSGSHCTSAKYLFRIHSACPRWLDVGLRGNSMHPRSRAANSKSRRRRACRKFQTVSSLVCRRGRHPFRLPGVARKLADTLGALCDGSAWTGRFVRDCEARASLALRERHAREIAAHRVGREALCSGGYPLAVFCVPCCRCTTHQADDCYRQRTAAGLRFSGGAVRSFSNCEIDPTPLLVPAFAFENGGHAFLDT